MDLPGVIEVTEFKFVQLKKVFISPDVPSSSVNCIATSNKYSLLFIGYSKGFKVVRVETILELDETSQGKDKSQPANNYNHRDVPLSSSPSVLALSCDETTLSVSILKDDVPVALMYDVRGFAANEPPYPFAEVRLSATPGTKLRQFCWNPSIPSEFAVCLTDGSATIYGIETETLKISGNLTAAEGVTALCWSPKGKQIVAGRKDGRLCQHKPNFQLSKIIPPPSAIGENSYVTSISWLATTLFAAVYVQRNGADNTTKLVLVSVPKGQSPTYTDFGDVCYGNGEREVIYWMQHIPEWKILICTSSNSLETAVIGYDDQGVWQQWSLEGTARAELPLFQRQETYPLGAGIVTCSSKKIVISPTESHPPMPILFLFSTSGLLCPFHIVNLFPGQPSLVTQPQLLSAEGRRKGKPPPPSPLGQPFQASTPVQRPYQEQATVNPPEYVPAAKTNLMNKFPEDNSNSQPTFSFAKLPQISSGNEETSSKTSKMAPFAVENQSQPANFQSDLSLTTNKGVDLSHDSGSGLNRKISRNILTPIAPSKTITSISKPSAPIPTPDLEKVGVENALTAALLEELKEFTKEIKESRMMLSQSQDSVGSDDEMTQIRNQTHEMRVFCEDVKKTVQSINLDVHLLKGCLFDTFAIFAEARSLDVRNKDPVYLSLLKKRALDPVSARKLKDIRKMCQYFDSQLSEIHARLDQDWEDYIDRRKRNTSVQRKTLSGVETVYRTLYNNLNAIKGLEDHVDKMTNAAKKEKLSFLSNVHRRTTLETQNTFDEDLSTLADSLLKTKISVSTEAKSGVTKNAPKAMAAEKENALREFLLNRRVPTVKATTINNLKDSRLLSTIQIMKETSSHWSGIERSHDNSDISKSDSEIKEALSSKESGLSSSGLKPAFSSLTEPNWPTTGMSTSAKSSFSSVASGDTVITSNTMIPVSKSENAYAGGITQGTPLTGSKTEMVKKTEPSQMKPFQSGSNQMAPPNITLPFHSPPVHMVAKTNAAIVSAPIMVPITAKNESKTMPPSQIQTPTTKQLPVFNFGKGAPATSSSSFVFSMGSKSPESTSTVAGFGPIKICEPTSFSAIGKPLAAINNESKSSTTNTSLFSFKEPTSLFSSSGNKNPSTSRTTTEAFKEPGTLFKELGNTSGSGATGSLFKEPVSSGTLFKELTGATQSSGSSSESRLTSEGQYEDITPPETPSQSDLINKEDETEEMTKVIEISVPNSTPEVKVKTIPSSIAAGFSFNSNLASSTTVTPTTSAKSSFSLAHLLKSDVTSSEVQKPSGFQFGGVSTKDGTPSFSFTIPPINNSTSSTSTIDSTKTTVTPIAVSSVVTTSSTVINSVTASNVTIPTNASSTAFTPVTSSLDKETPTSKPEEKESLKEDDTEDGPPPLSSSPAKESETENNQPKVKATPTSQSEQQPPPPPYPTGQAAFPTSTAPSNSGAPTFGVGSSLFGKPSAQRNLFGQPTPETSFGTPPTTSQSSGSLFGNLTSFGQSKPSTFGQPASSTAAPVFGNVSSPNTPFGTPNNAPVGIFGPPATQQNPSFGSPATSQSFGQSTQSSGFSAFGQQQPSTFSQAGNTSIGSSSGGAFSISKPLFGQSGSSVFGQVTKPATSPSGSLFGQQPPASSIFDQNTSFFGGLGGQPSAENANKNVFGSPSFQNQSPSSGGLFGNQSPGGFGTKFGNSSFTGGSFSAGGTSVAETGFGAFNQAEQQNTPTKLSTGASPGFGSPPVFGGSPIFGSNTFGISTVQQNTGAFQSSPFGSTNTATPMFDALASQAPTFGSLSQQPAAAPSFGSVPSGFGSPSSFGGQSSGIGSQSSAFTQWRQ